MSDFFQSGAITTLHRLRSGGLARMERELAEFARETPIALVLPCHARELGSAALKRIVRELRSVRYLRQIVVGIDAANRADWLRARRVFSVLPGESLLVWNDGPRMRRLLRRLDAVGRAGKGRNVWMCIGCVLAAGQASVVAVHDCDIIGYDRELLARLCYPIAHPEFGFAFCKGYYARVTDRLHGRATRLLVTPLLRALREIVGPHPLLVFLDTFRYPLAGEIAMRLEMAERIRIPHDWSLEIGTLAEVFRSASPRAVCQSALCDGYDHKHQSLGSGETGPGLKRAAVDIVAALFRNMAAEGIRLDDELFAALPADYARHAEESLRAYSADAAINGLRYPRGDEERAVAAFAQSIGAAAKVFQNEPCEMSSMPAWDIVRAVLPEFGTELLDVVACDARE